MGQCLYLKRLMKIKNLWWRRIGAKIEFEIARIGRKKEEKSWRCNWEEERQIGNKQKHEDEQTIKQRQVAPQG